MATIIEPADGTIPDTQEIVPNIDLLDGRLRLHFYPQGLTFGLVDPQDTRFAIMLTYGQARDMMLKAARIEARGKE